MAPFQRARGYRWILVNGEVTIRDDQQTQCHPGLLLRHGGATPDIADDTAHRRVAA